MPLANGPIDEFCKFTGSSSSDWPPGTERLEQTRYRPEERGPLAFLAVKQADSLESLIDANIAAFEKEVRALALPYLLGDRNSVLKDAALGLVSHIDLLRALQEAVQMGNCQPKAQSA